MLVLVLQAGCFFVRLSVTLVDCDHTVQQRVEIGT